MHDSGGGGTTSVTKVFGNIFISFIGAGVLGLPFAFKEAGILEGIVIMSTVGYLSVRAMLLLIDCKDYMVANNYHLMKKHPERNTSNSSNDTVMYGRVIDMEEVDEDHVKIHPKKKKHKDSSNGKEEVDDVSYSDVAYFAFGQRGTLIVDVAIVVSQTGFCCAYLIFISENLAQYISSPPDIPHGEDIPTTEPGLPVQRWILFFMMIPLCFLCFLRKLHKLAMFSIFADFANVFAYSIVFWFDFEHAHTITKQIHPKEMDLDGFPFFAGMAVYCYEGAGMILSLESSMASEVRYKFRNIFKIAMLIITSLYILFGVCGYLSFGAETNPIITLNLPAGVFPMLVKLCLCFSLFFTYPVMMFPVIQIIQKRWPKAGSSYFIGNCLRAGMVVLTGFIILCIPSFSNLMLLVGATFCSLLAFILPALFHLKTFRGQLSKLQRVQDYILIATGLFATVIGTLDAFKRMGIIPEGGDDVLAAASVAELPTVEDLQQLNYSST